MIEQANFIAMAKTHKTMTQCGTRLDQSQEGMRRAVDECLFKFQLCYPSRVDSLQLLLIALSNVTCILYLVCFSILPMA